ncbi:hypothetical protein NX784_21710 [Massilia pinisoli]|uniref:Uncharacterized protein n=1 Tax=Massilia pinisoli TaxID=1772194 RepID=A0ABT1ZW92_9BURK|nr:hypothetical protein [Massilia pinisoli]MCS0584217.1 hypothetical protein [Massilia pinisoli]
MRHTLKAVFAHRSDTQHVLDELLASNYSRANTARVGPIGIEDLDDEPAHGSVDAGTDVPGTRFTYPPGTEPGSLQRRAHEDSRYFGTQSADSPPTGNTFEATMGADSQWVHPDDGRLHVPTPASSQDTDSAAHDDYMAAYLYGSEARRSENDRDKDWRDVEPALAAAWKTRHAGNASSTWDKVKAAVRHGWDRVRS